jgi:hypothetical protein
MSVFFTVRNILGMQYQDNLPDMRTLVVIQVELAHFCELSDTTPTLFYRLAVLHSVLEVAGRVGRRYGG